MTEGAAPLIAPGHLAANWKRLRAARGEHLIEVVLCGGVTVALALTPARRPRFFLPADPRRGTPGGDLTGENLIVSPGFLRFGGRDQPCLDVGCGAESLDRTFAEFASAVFERIHMGQRPRDALAETVREFRRLLRHAAAQPVSRERALGLLGELCLLAELQKFDAGAWETWNGPLGQVHDFLNGRQALEVKSATPGHEPVVEISSIDQLYPPAGGVLHLWRFVFTPNANGTLSVPELAGTLRAALDDCTGLDERLGALGYDPAAPEAWNSHRFTLTQRDLYLVGPGFPRLDRNAVIPLPDGVSHLRFRVDLALAAAMRLGSRAEEEAALRHFLEDA